MAFIIGSPNVYAPVIEATVSITTPLLILTGGALSSTVVEADTVRNKTAGGPITIQTQSASAAINLSPHSTGSVVVKSGCPLVADTLRPSAGLALGFVTNGSTRLTIPNAGIASGSTSDNLLVMNGTALETRVTASLSTGGVGVFDVLGFTGPVSCTIKWVIFNGLVVLRIASFTGVKSGAGAIVIDPALPTDARPAGTIALVNQWTAGSSGIPLEGSVVILSSGVISFYSTPICDDFVDTTLFGHSGPFGTRDFTFSYLNY